MSAASSSGIDTDALGTSMFTSAELNSSVAFVGDASHHSSSQLASGKLREEFATSLQESRGVEVKTALFEHPNGLETDYFPQGIVAIDSSGSLALDPPAANGPLDGLFYESTKRVLDILGSAFLMLLLSPVLIFAALLVKLTDGGAVFYPHTRVGEGGNEFTCYKFRSMVVNADKMKSSLAFYNAHDDHRTFKIPDDPRVTWIGRWMRRTSIDELPQLWNVFCGQMSLVGPRPPVVSEVEQYTLDDMQRLTVKPGLTCIWQVSGRSRLPFPEQLRLDKEYIENRSLALDVKLLAKTIPAVLSADGAY